MTPASQISTIAASAAPIPDQPTLKKRWSRKVVSDLIAIADLSAISVAAILTAVGKGAPHGHGASFSLSGAELCLLIVAASHLTLREAGAYRAVLHTELRASPLWLVTALLAAFVGTSVTVQAVAGPTAVSLSWLVFWFAASTAGLAIVRLTASGLLSSAVAKGKLRHHVGVFGAGRIADIVAAQARDPASGIQLVGVFDDRQQVRQASSSRTSTSGNLESLIAMGRQDLLDEIVIALPQSADCRITEIVRKLEHLPVKLSICTHIAGELCGLSHPAQAVRSLGPLGLLDVKPRPLNDWAPFIKRLEDATISGIALFLLAPVFLGIAIAIKRDSPGPVFFRQRRHGFNHRVFHVLKFRSMAVMEDGGKVEQARRADPRVTKVGRFLRRTSLDELPQLINIFLGDMSLVGPRPHAIAHNEHYETVVDRYASRTQVKPGLTGWAQVSGFRGETRDTEAMRARVEHDLTYIENWSLWLDMRILVSTLWCGFVHPNAF